MEAARDAASRQYLLMISLKHAPNRSSVMVVWRRYLVIMTEMTKMELNIGVEVVTQFVILGFLSRTRALDFSSTASMRWVIVITDSLSALIKVFPKYLLYIENNK